MRKLDALLAAYDGAVAAGAGEAPEYRKAYGSTSLDSVFDAASVAKSFAAVAAHRLAREGKLRFSDPLGLLLPDLAYLGVTLDQLLRQTSGLFDLYADAPLRAAFLEFLGDRKRPYYNEDYRAFLAERRPLLPTAPGTGYRYSNTNYVLLALALEAAAGDRYDRLLAKTVLQPAGLRSTTVCGSWNVPQGARPGAGVTYGDDDLMTTAEDLYRFAQTVSNGTLLTETERIEAWKPSVLADGSRAPYGRGFQIRVDSPRPYVYHTGGTAGFRAFVKFAAPDDPAMVVFWLAAEPPAEEFRRLCAGVVEAVRDLRPSGH